MNTCICILNSNFILKRHFNADVDAAPDNDAELQWQNSTLKKGGPSDPSLNWLVYILTFGKYIYEHMYMYIK